jgi:N-acetylglucosaminyl-diphospho-decaprenol L-rhamnosyltransferase
LGKRRQEVTESPGRSLTVSIVNTKQYDWLGACLNSVLEHPYKRGPFEIVVLDNASEDGSVEKLQAEYPQVRVMAETVRRGFGANHGLVAEWSNSDVVLFLNPDTVMHEGTLDRLVEAFDVDERVVLAGGPILDPDGTVWRGAPFSFPSPWRSLKEAVGLHRLGRLPVAPGGVSVGTGWLSGSALMVDRRVFLALGGFDPRFFLYFEETDLCKRVTEAGGLIAFHSGAPVTHEGRTTERAASADKKLSAAEMKTTTEFERSGVRYMRKHFGRGGAAVYRASLVVGGGIRLVASYTPLGATIDVKGDDLPSTRAHHQRRIGVAVRPGSGVSIGDGAAAYNLEHSG